MRHIVETRKLAEYFVAHGKSGRLVVFEGMPGAGKTTTLTSLAAGNIRSTVPELNHHADPEIRDSGSEEGLLDDWYLKNELKRQDNILKELATGSLIFQDRNVLGLLAYIYARAMMRQDEEGFADYVNKLVRARANRFLFPDGLIILWADEKVSLQRRRTFSEDQRYALWFNPVFLSHYGAFYRNFAADIVPEVTKFVDTSHLSAQAVLSIVRDYIRKREIIPSGSGF